jgi:hypothetical protein
MQARWARLFAASEVQTKNKYWVGVCIIRGWGSGVGGTVLGCVSFRFHVQSGVDECF